MRDVQNEIDSRGVFIDKVGIRNLRVPLEIIVPGQAHPVSTVATLSLYVPLSHEFRGVNMSRFSEVVFEIMQSKAHVSLHLLKDIAQALIPRMAAPAAYVKARFPYFVMKEAPVSKKKGYVDYDCTLDVCYKDGQFESYVMVDVPYTSLCACSKEISQYGAHNQRSLASVRIKLLEDTLVYFEELIRVVEENASSELYSVLKRPDEKYVTEQAYNNPRFVEDMARELYLRLMRWVEEKKCAGFVTVINHFESIHNHDAVAVVRGGAFVA